MAKKQEQNYIIVKAASDGELTEKVNKLSDKYQPLGGMSVTYYVDIRGAVFLYEQAMTRKEGK